MSQVLGANSQAITGAQLLVTGVGVVYGFIVSAHSSGTIKLWNSTTASGDVILDTFTFVSGSGSVTFPAPLNFRIGLYADISADESVTVVFNEA